MSSYRSKNVRYARSQYRARGVCVKLDFRLCARDSIPAVLVGIYIVAHLCVVAPSASAMHVTLIASSHVP